MSEVADTYYYGEPCLRLTPAEEVRLRHSLEEIEKACFLEAIPRSDIRLMSAWITQRPPKGEGYAAQCIPIPRPTQVATPRRRWWHRLRVTTNRTRTGTDATTRKGSA